MTTKIVGVIAILLAVLSLPLSFDSLGVLVALLAVFVASISAFLKNISHSIIAALIATVAIFGASPLPQILKQTESVGTSIETSSYNQELVNPTLAGERTEIYIQKRMGDQQEIKERNKIFLAIIGGVYFLYITAIGYALHRSSNK
ncbi:MAG: hypothetical protein WC856_11735 [Methylococcaceae bacterium]|jgi:hypothetical protein